MSLNIEQGAFITLGASGWPAMSAIAEKCSFGTLNISQTIFCFSAKVSRIDSSRRLSRSITKTKKPKKKMSNSNYVVNSLMNLLFSVTKRNPFWKWISIKIVNIPFGVRTGSAVRAGLMLTCTSLGATNDDCCVSVRVLFELLEYTSDFRLDLSHTSSSANLTAARAPLPLTLM